MSAFGTKQTLTALSSIQNGYLALAIYVATNMILLLLTQT